METSKMVKKMLSEPKEVKLSVGGTKEFRSVMDFVLLNARYQDYYSMRVVTRTYKEIAEMVETEFSADVLNEAKSVYFD